MTKNHQPLTSYYQHLCNDPCCRLIHTWETWKKSSVHSVCPWGQVRVKVLSPNSSVQANSQRSQGGQSLTNILKAFKLSTRKINLGVYCFLQTIDHLTKININIHSLRYKYNQFNLHQKDTKKQLSGASFIYIKHITNYEI